MSTNGNGTSNGAEKENDHDAIMRLAKLPPMEFDRVCKSEADALGITAATLKGQVKRARKPNAGEGAMQAHWEVSPWGDDVSPAKLFAQIKRRIRRHVVMSDHASTAVVLWVMFAWAHDAAVHSPILLVNSPEAECGKSTLLGLIKFIVPRGVVLVDISGAVLYRMIEKWHPTLIVDEADDTFKTSPELRQVINSGWTRGAGVPRCHPDTHEPEFFETFGPKAIGLKGLKVPDTTLTRSIIIDMQRKLPGDTAASFAHIDDAELAEMRRKLSRFAQDYRPQDHAAPLLPAGFNNRLEANWNMLIAIGELCGVGEKARQAADALSVRNDDASLGVELLRDIRDIFRQRGIDRIRSEELVNKLVAQADRPWPEMPYSGKPITQSQLAKLLKGYGVRSKQVRFDAVTLKGYMLEDFDKAWRYIPAERGDVPPESAETPKQPQKSAKVGETNISVSRNGSGEGETNVSARMAENGQCFAVSPNSEGADALPEPGAFEPDFDERDVA